MVEGLRLRLGTALVAAENGFTLGVRAPGQTYKQCLAANSANYSLAGAFTRIAVPPNELLATMSQVCFSGMPAKVRQACFWRKEGRTQSALESAQWEQWEGGLGGWPCQSIRFTLKGAPSKLRLGGVVQTSQTPGSP